MRKTTTFLGIYVVIALVSLLFGCVSCIAIPMQILFGWVYFLFQTVPEMSVDWTAVGTGAVSLILLTTIAHGLARWLYRSSSIAEERTPWRFRWTLAGVLGSLFVFTASVAMVAMFYQTGWLFSGDEPVIDGGSRNAARRSQSSNNLKQIALGCHNYHEIEHRLPPGGTFDPYGEPLQSWETHLLPYIEQGSIKPNMSLPWNHPENTKHFRTEIMTFLHPAFPERKKPDSAEGFALSHYAANRHVMRDNFSISFKDATDGTSNTILMGEVGANFKPWGDPINWRDPALGINRSPDGFGGPPRYRGSQFSLMDGSVRFISEDTDPEVLKALATPSGGEKVAVP